MIHQVTQGISISVETVFKGTYFKNYQRVFAFAYEICASNFTLDEQEVDLLKNMQTHWKLKPSVVKAVKLSAELRYRN